MPATPTLNTQVIGHPEEEASVMTPSDCSLSTG
jgi:hypothetical protein